MDKLYYGNGYTSDVDEMPLSHIIARRLDEIWERRESEGKTLWKLVR
ncbi:MAG: hypothetical protein WCI72_03480 [archaeon]|jgi:hypothetical protein